jgi:hypothetical protein
MHLSNILLYITRCLTKIQKSALLLLDRMIPTEINSRLEMVQINIDTSIFDIQFLRPTFSYAPKPQHTRVGIVLYTTTTETGGNDTSVCVRYSTAMAIYGTSHCFLH